MAIYTPAHFASHDAQAALQLMHDHPFATLVTSAGVAESHISHIPLLYEDGMLLGHLARPNPHWRQFELGSSVAVFQGPHAYISPFWYEHPEDNVPTWNYAVVHAHGRPELLDVEHNHHHLEQLFARFNPGQRLPTTTDKLKRLLGGIVAFRMPIEHLDVKFKMSQNKTPTDRAGVAQGLRSTGRPQDHTTAEWMVTYG